jgi:hypothetical protein
MNDVIDAKSTVTEIRTAKIVATEINFIKRQTQKIMLSSSIEIGRRLAEAKSLVDHGHWGEWLQENVSYSDRTAQNLIKIFEQYGDKGMDPLLGTDPEAFEELSYTQAVALLSFPTVDEREKFVGSHNIQDMSTRELQDAIKAQKDAEEKAANLQTLFAAQKDVLAEKEEKAKEDRKKAKSTIKELNAEIGELQGKLDQQTDKKKEKEMQTEIKNLQSQIAESKTREAERVEQMQKEIAAVKQSAADTDMQVFSADLDAVQHSFNRMIEHIQSIATPEKRKKFERAAKKLLAKLDGTLK